MDETVDLLISRLSGREIVPSHVPYLVRDILNIVRDDAHISLKNINVRLESLGWANDIIDDYILELILRTMDRQLIAPGGYMVK